MIPSFGHYNTLLKYEQVGSGLSLQISLYFQGFWGLKFNVWLLV